MSSETFGDPGFSAMGLEDFREKIQGVTSSRVLRIEVGGEG